MTPQEAWDEFENSKPNPRTEIKHLVSHYHTNTGRSFSWIYRWLYLEFERVHNMRVDENARNRLDIIAIAETR